MGGVDPRAWCARTTAVLRSAGVADAEAIRLAPTLLDRYAEPHRVYHDPRHIDFLFEFAAKHGVQLTPVQAVAVLYHDVIYQLGARDNEARSAEVLVQELKAAGGIPHADIQEAAAIVRDTAQHFVPEPVFESQQSPVVLDIDIGNMSLPYAEFLTWNRRVADEFVGQPLSARVKFLQDFLARPRVTMSAEFAWMEQPIRDNLSRLLGELQGS